MKNTRAKKRKYEERGFYQENRALPNQPLDKM